MKSLLLVFVFLAACTRSTNSPGEKSPVEKGRSFYNTHCIACHNPNPRLDGAVGPSVYGSSLDLLEHRVLKSDYPPEYKPKRNTRVMQPLPFLKDDIPALHAYLNAP